MVLVIFDKDKDHGKVPWSLSILKLTGTTAGGAVPRAVQIFCEMKARQKQRFGTGSVVLVIFEKDKDHSRSGCPRVFGKLYT